MTTSTDLGIIPSWTIGDRLRKARETTGLDQTQFANEIGVSRRGVSAAESGETKKPRQILLRAWSLRTGVSLHWLETGEAPSPGGDGASGASLLPESNRRPSYYKFNTYRPVTRRSA